MTSICFFNLYIDLMLRRKFYKTDFFLSFLRDKMQIRRSQKPFLLGPVALFHVFFVCMFIVELQCKGADVLQNILMCCFFLWECITVPSDASI